MDNFPTNRIVKIGVVVKNLEAAIKAYCAIFKVDPPEILVPKDENKQSSDGKELGPVFRGKRELSRCRVACINLTPIYIELIEPYDEPSPWQEFKEKHDQGVHYVAFEHSGGGFEETEKLMARYDMPIYFKVERGNSRYGYFDSAEKLGVSLELKVFD
jgi:hypothetical protein